MSARRRHDPWVGPEPAVYPPFVSAQHGRFWHGLWHRRMVLAWHRAWDHNLIETVQFHADGDGGFYTVPSQTQEDAWYCVRRYPLAPDGYLWLCDCSASQKGGVVCAHAMAAYLWRLRHRLRWRLKKPQGGSA